MQETGAGSVAKGSFVKTVWTGTENRRPATWQHDLIFIVSAPNAARRKKLQKSKVWEANRKARLLELEPLVMEKGATVNGGDRPRAWYASDDRRSRGAWANMRLLEGIFAAFAEQAMGS